MGKFGDVPKKFIDLHYKIGDGLSVETINPAKRYPVKLIGVVENSSILVTAPRVQGKEFMLPEGQLLRLRMMADNIACGFQTRVLRACRVPYLYVHLAYPQKIEAVAVRQASRVRLELPVLLEEFEKDTLHGVWPKKAYIVDMSSGGARLQSKAPLAAVGSELMLTFRVVIDTVVRVDKVKAIVRNITEVGDSVADAGYQYGVQFLDVSDVNRIHISGYVYEQILTQGEH